MSRVLCARACAAVLAALELSKGLTQRAARGGPRVSWWVCGGAVGLSLSQELLMLVTSLVLVFAFGGLTRGLALESYLYRACEWRPPWHGPQYEVGGAEGAASRKADSNGNGERCLYLPWRACRCCFCSCT